MEDDFLTIDRERIAAIVAKRRRIWSIAAPAVWGVTLAAALVLVPRTFSASASIALQQASGGAAGGNGGALASLSSLTGGGAKSYSGVLKSRRFAEDAVRAASIRTLYGLPSDADAAELLRNAVSVDDRKDGLIYIGVSLPGPARFAPDSAEKAERVKKASRIATAAYIAALRNYLATSNTDRDAALIREAQKQLATARRDYDASVRELSDFVRTGGKNVAEPGSAGSTLASLYLTRGGLEGEIRSMEAAQQATVGLAGRTDLSTLPSEDPLLADARRGVRLAQGEVDGLRVEFSDENPQVVAARERLSAAQNRLRRESAALRDGQTSEGVRLDALKAKYETVSRQIRDAEKTFQSSRTVGVDFEQRRNDVALRLEILKTTASQYATLSISTVAGDNLMDVVDAPEASPFATPGVGTLVIGSLFATAFLFGVWLTVDYLRAKSEIPEATLSLPVAAAPGQTSGVAHG